MLGFKLKYFFIFLKATARHIRCQINNNCPSTLIKNCLLSITSCLPIILELGVFTTPAWAGSAPTKNTASNSALENKKSTEFSVFPVGINLKQRTVNSSALVKGAENGSKAIAFKQWLIPFDVVVEALNLQVRSLEGGMLELRSPGIVTRINPQNLISDPDLGLAWRVSQIEDILGVTTKFDLQRYAIVFVPPWLDLKQNNRAAKPEVSMEGLTKINPNNFSFTTLGQRLRLNNNDVGDKPNGMASLRSFDTSSDLSAIGTVLGGSWYTEVNQGSLGDLSSWQLGELQYLRQTDRVDYALGSQSTFWQSPSERQYWGFTSLQRFGYTPEPNLSSSGFNASLRRQPQAVNRAIAGVAQPGDVVHLVTRGGQEILQEVSVDETRQYQFDNVDARQNDYQILIYPNGRLTVAPEIREPILTHVSGQLSQGTSTLAASLGINRDLSADNFWGEFKDLGGGVNYRRGVSEELTLGTGLVVDGSLFALGELFYQPNNVPLQLGISALVNPQFEDADYAAYFNYQPTDKLNLSFSGNGSSHDLRLNWLASSNLILRLGNDNRDNITTGLNFSKSFLVGKKQKKQQFSLYGSLDYGDRMGLSQRINARYSAWQFAHQGDSDATFSRLSYYLSNNAFSSKGQSLFLGYDTRSSIDSNDVINLGWQYRSPQNATEGGSLWDVELGYGFNARGSAPLAALTTRALPGTTLRLSYQGISADNNDSRLRIDVFPNLRLQGRPSLGDRNMDKLRTKGGILVRPFVDLNTNGKLDRGERIQTEDAGLLLTVNHEPLETAGKDVTKQGVYIPVVPGEYRLDLDPAGYPLNSQPIESSYGIEVTAGSYTKLDIPFTPSYTVIGVVTDSQNNPVAGARVQAIPSKSSRPILSVTNSAGVYFLEGLSQDTYDLTVNDRPIDLEPLTITPNSEPLQEININM